MTEKFNPYQPLTLKQLSSWKPEQPPEILSNGLLPKGHVMFLYGEEETWKSWLIIDMVFSIANNLPWLVYKTMPVKCLVINPEIPAKAYKDRIELFHKTRNLTPANDELLRFWTDLDLRIDDSQGKTRLLHYAKQFMPDLIVVDGLEFVVRGDLATALTASALRDTINQARAICNCSFVLVHHKKKSAYDVTGKKLSLGVDEMYGHSILKNMADTIIMVEKDTRDEEVILVKSQKTRMSPLNKPPPLPFRFSREQLEFALWLGGDVEEQKC